MKQAQRHQEIIELLSQCGFASTEELVAHFDVSPQTIRRDLNELAEQNKIQRHHGGASLPSSGLTQSYNGGRESHWEEKQRIARVVASRIPDGASLFIGIGAAPEAVARALLDHRDLRIVTNNLNVASLLTARDDFMVSIAGGEIRNRDGAILGAVSHEHVKQFRMDFAILGVSGVDELGGLLTADLQERHISRSMLELASRGYVIVEHWQFIRSGMVHLAQLAEIDTLFTDHPLPAPVAELLLRQGVECVIC
ncbi:MAG: DeoR family transcriptional regulator [Aeromonadaceae bacterium]